METPTTSHTKTNSIGSSSMMMYTDARSSMDVIEGTTQQFGGNNKKPETDARIQRQRWDAFFEPQYSFGAFIHGLNQKEEHDQKHQHQKKIDRLVDDGNYLLEPNTKSPMIERASYDFGATTEASTAAMTPTLPHVSMCEDEDDETDEQVAWGPKDEKTLIERLELLKKMRAQHNPTTATVTDHEEEYRPLGSIRSETTQSTVHWKQYISKKAKQFYQEAKRHPSTASRSTLSSLDPDEKIIKNQDEEEEATTATGCRRSFLCFVLGFLFPPLWLFGAFYFSSYANRQTSASRRMDHIWRRRSRIAFGIFIISLMIILVIIFVLKPGSVGWRLSKAGN